MKENNMVRIEPTSIAKRSKPSAIPQEDSGDDNNNEDLKSDRESGEHEEGDNALLCKWTFEVNARQWKLVNKLFGSHAEASGVLRWDEMDKVWLVMCD